MNAFYHALTFLTKIPVPWLRSDDAAWKKSVAFYPVVGLLIGIALWCFQFITSQIFSPLLTAVLTLVCWVYLTGGLHLDGWMDLADGLGSNRSRERILEIMKDSRVGAMGVLAAILLLLVKSVALLELMHQGSYWLMYIPMAARTFLLLAIYYWPYLTKGGIATGMKEGLKSCHLGLNFALLIGAALLTGGVQALAATILTLVGSLWFCYRVAKRLTGLSGDCYGALIEWSEVICLLSIVGTGRGFA